MSTDRTRIDVAPAAASMVVGQLRYGELLLGAHTPYKWRKLTGWEELPEQDSGNVPRPAAHGAYLGRLLSQTRTVGLDEMIVRASADELGDVVGQLGAATGLVDDELPLLVHIDTRGPLLVWARVVRRTIPVERGYSVGTVTEAALEWEATDPRRYAPAVQCAETGLPEPCLPWHTDPADGSPRGAPASTGDLVACNFGRAPTHPVVEFVGPVDTPRLTNVTTGAVLEYDVILDAGEQLTVDTFDGSATLAGGESLLHAASVACWPEAAFTLAPGENVLTFRAAPDAPADPRAAAVLRWRSAHW
ncbi:phage distal tail protein [Streptomyces sp. NPDC059008]|uniref:phage distal tail protein n=1 Tax=Streptomyces sp. NPDC059008 TaxID=3346693 RepID=UPI00369E9ECF